MLPATIVRWLLRVRRRGEGGDVDHGYNRFDLPLLASYSRSGTNWIRYVVESISGKPTPGQRRVHSGRDYVIDRAHNAGPTLDLHPKVILVVRDYKECITRHFDGRTGDVTRLLTNERVAQRPRWYIDNLAAFDAFEGPKLLLYYEDLMIEIAEHVRRVAVFLELDADRTDLFLQHLDEHYEASARAYRRGGHRTETAGVVDPEHHARTHLTPEQIRTFDRFYRSRYPALTDKYLRRYQRNLDSDRVRSGSSRDSSEKKDPVHV